MMTAVMIPTEIDILEVLIAARQPTDKNLSDTMRRFFVNTLIVNTTQFGYRLHICQLIIRSNESVSSLAAEIVLV